MTASQIKDYPLSVLCAAIANILTIEQIEDQIKKFSETIVETSYSECKLCSIYHTHLFDSCGEMCPYQKFENENSLGCIAFSKIVYDGIVENTIRRNIFGPSSRIAALNRYKLALIIKRE